MTEKVRRIRPPYDVACPVCGAQIDHDCYRPGTELPHPERMAVSRERRQRT